MHPSGKVRIRSAASPVKSASAISFSLLAEFEPRASSFISAVMMSARIVCSKRNEYSASRQRFVCLHGEAVHQWGGPNFVPIGCKPTGFVRGGLIHAHFW